MPPEPATIRWAGPDEWPALAILLADLNDHYGVAPETETALAEKARAWLAERPGAGRFVLAFRAGRPAGFASVAVVRPVPGPGGALYMKELYVAAFARNGGIGRDILAFLARYCAAEGLERIDFTTETDNEAALRFYALNGAVIQTRKVALRFDAAALDRLAGLPPRS